MILYFGDSEKEYDEVTEPFKYREVCGKETFAYGVYVVDVTPLYIILEHVDKTAKAFTCRKCQ